MHEEARQQMARLRALIAYNEAKVRADPIPALEEAAELIGRQDAFIRELEDVLRGSDVIFDAAEALDIKLHDFQGEAVVRVDKALTLIRTHFREKYAKHDSRT